MLKRWHASNKYECAELASYGEPNEPRSLSLPWKYYPVLPANEGEARIYNAKQTNQFGEWKFESVCLDFKPDIVVDIRDMWMNEFQQRSPFRPYYNLVWMPTVDAVPQDEQWIASMISADGVFTYTDWAADVLRKEGGGKINVLGSASPGADLQSYKVIPDKRAHKRSLGVDEDIFVIGTLMRNQKRKLYPDLVEAFAKFLKVAPSELGRKTYLYLHTSYPDIGWDIPRLIKEAGVASKTLFTYYCQNPQCGRAFVSFFADVNCYCKHCNQPSAIFPRTVGGVNRHVLCDILNLFDIYVQYSCAEGAGMPQIEAGACGTHVMSVDYSAMSDIVRKLEGTPINVQRYHRESETHRYMALPDNDDFIAKAIAYLQLPEPIKTKNRFSTRRAAERYYNWDAIAQKWEKYFDGVPLSEKWNSPKTVFSPILNVPAGLTNEDFANWAMVNILGKPELTNSYLHVKLIRDLNWGVTPEQAGGYYFNEEATIGNRINVKDFGQRQAAEKLIELRNFYNFWEEKRCEKAKTF